jgi:hypothetical protein
MMVPSWVLMGSKEDKNRASVKSHRLQFLFFHFFLDGSTSRFDTLPPPPPFCWAVRWSSLTPPNSLIHSFRSCFLSYFLPFLLPFFLRFFYPNFLPFVLYLFILFHSLVLYFYPSFCLISFFIYFTHYLSS